MQKKWMSMTSEEKEKLQEDWRNRCGPQFKEERPQQ
jgi:hypothetical protein